MSETERTRGLLLLGSELGGAHGSPQTHAAIFELLWGLPWLQTTVVDTWDALRWEAVAPYDVVVHYGGGRKFACTDAQLEGVSKLVSRGGGYVPLHFTSANANDAFIAFVGARFVGHPPHSPMTVRVADAAHPITRGLPTIEIEDECYRSDYPDPGAIHVLQTSHHESGIDGEPSAWVREVGRGRIFYSALGHDARSFSHPVLRELLTRGIRWAAGMEPVAPPAADAADAAAGR